VDVTDATFAAEVLGADDAVLVDFWAPWCAPCKAIAPILEELAAGSGGRVRLAKLNVDENPQVAADYGVLSLPTVILFEDGEPRETVVGARSRKHFERAFGDWVSA
jgi:thioredoxin 1